MIRAITPRVVSGTIAAIPSKSQAHRLLIGAALSNRPTVLHCTQTSADIEATAACLCGFGAKTERTHEGYTVTPIEKQSGSRERLTVDVGESGSTLRFLLPIAGALGLSVRFVLHGRLPQRPLSPLWEELTAHGMTLTREADGSVCADGQLQAGEYRLPGNISSQFISGLLFALPLLPADSRICLTTTVESASYIRMTQQVLAQFGVRIKNTAQTYTVPGGQVYRAASEYRVEGDWSNAAFALSMGALGGSGVTVTDLCLESMQGDRKILDLLRAFGAKVSVTDSSVTVRPAPLHGITIDAADIPDLVPVLAAVATVAQGETQIIHAERLRIKESNRLQTVGTLLRTLGAEMTETVDGLYIYGGKPLHGGTVDAAGDHRIAMTAAVASVKCSHTVTVLGAEAVHKSYPAFWADFAALGAQWTTITEKEVQK